jgi:type IV secretion system protein VirB2
MKSLFKKENILFMLCTAFLMTEPAFAAGGRGDISSFLNTIATVLTSVGVITITIAIMWAGYKIAFGGATFREMGPVLIGGALVGSAAWIAGQLMGS